MPDYMRTQNPWLSAAESMNNAADPLARMLVQLPQIRAQMQQHADRMAIEQGQLGLQQQETQAKIPLYQSQATENNANAAKLEAENAKLKQLIAFAIQASQGETNPVVAGLTGSAGLDSGAAGRLIASRERPVVVPANATMMSPQGQPMGQGMVSAPIGNNVFAPQSTGTNAPAQVQQGQFRPPTAGRDPLAQLVLNATAGMANQNIPAPNGMWSLEDILAMTNLIPSQASSPQPVTNEPSRIKAIRQIR